MRKYFCYTVWLLTVVLLTNPAIAQNILEWHTKAGGNETTLASDYTAPGLETSLLKRGKGLIAAASYGNSFNARFSPTADRATALAKNMYYEFSITPQSQNKVSLAAINIKLYRNEDPVNGYGGPNTYQWAYKIGHGDIQWIGNPVSFTTINPSGGEQQPELKLSGISALQNFSGTVTFYLYAWGGTAPVKVALSGLPIGKSTAAEPLMSVKGAVNGTLPVKTGTIQEKGVTHKPESIPSKKTDHTSKVPKSTFSKTLIEQENELKSDPLVKRFAESRKNFKNDKYRPLYHFTSPEGRLNDPNGLSFWQGRWHLFYQGYPPEDSRQHWGHAVSTDLIHWKDLPYAIYPSPERAVYSGSVYVEEDRAIAMYHGTQEGNMVAVSSDPLLLNWEKLTGKAVIPLRGTKEQPLPFSVFDPFIWKKDGVYYSLSESKNDKRALKNPLMASHLFKSKDLVNWEYMHEFVENDRFTLSGDDGACPYFWPIGNKYIMPFFSHMSGGQYFLGDYDKERDKFIVTSHGKFNFGAVSPAGVHAPSAYPDGNGGVIVIFNMNDGFKTNGWNQLMTLPRRLTLEGESDIRIEPAGDIESLRYAHQVVEAMKLPANKEVVIEQLKGNAMEIIAEIDPQHAPMIEMNVLRSENKEEFTRISFFKERGYSSGKKYETNPANKIRNSLVSIETSYSSILPGAKSRAPETAPVMIEPGENLKLRVFIDKSIVEVYVNGKQCLAVRVYPGMEDSTGISFRSQGQDSELKSLQAWQMKSIYE